MFICLEHFCKLYKELNWTTFGGEFGEQMFTLDFIPFCSILISPLQEKKDQII